MKNRCVRLLSIFLAAVLLLIGCLTVFAFENSDTNNIAESDSFDELFSDRDISGEYDASEAVIVSLNDTLSQADSDSVQISGSDVIITGAGTYLFSGSLNNGSIIVEADKEDKVQMVLDNVSIHSDTFAAIYVVQADKVFVTLADGSVNSLSNSGTFVPINDNDVDAVVYAKDDITFNGTGTLKISSPGGHGIVGKDEVTFADGSYEISASDSAISGKDSIAVADGSFILTSDKDGLHSENSDDETLGNIYIKDGSFVIRVSDDAIHANTLLQIDGGSFEITASEGLEASYIRINEGEINISAADDGINAAYKSSVYTPTVEINGGTIVIVMSAGDTDGIDSNSDIIINGGTVNITGNSGFDYDGKAQYNGGTIIVNGTTLNSIPSQMMGGGNGRMNRNGRANGFRQW